MPDKLTPYTFTDDLDLNDAGFSFEEDEIWLTLNAYLDGELSPIETSHVEAMLKSDIRYATAFNSLKHTSLFTRSIEQVEPPVNLQASILKATSQKMTLAKRLKVWQRELAKMFRPAPARFAFASGLAAAGIVGFFIYSRVQPLAPTLPTVATVQSNNTPSQPVDHNSVQVPNQNSSAFNMAYRAVLLKPKSSSAMDFAPKVQPSLPMSGMPNRSATSNINLTASVKTEPKSDMATNLSTNSMPQTAPHKDVKGNISQEPQKIAHAETKPSQDTMSTTLVAANNRPVEMKHTTESMVEGSSGIAATNALKEKIEIPAEPDRTVASADIPPTPKRIITPPPIVEPTHAPPTGQAPTLTEFKVAKNNEAGGYTKPALENIRRKSIGYNFSSSF